jgi:hypothetical protein
MQAQRARISGERIDRLLGGEASSYWPFEGSGSFSGLASRRSHFKQPTVYFLAPLPQWIFSGRELIAWSNMMELSVYSTWSGLPNEIAT